ncbi:hypothetical protein EJB05_31797 [Eragrostis curvula]|uniref:Uncharacterized protein n=1 Tax=Eragrostis curvula TaxID=38414 RepID=A0A5J9UEG2_9POAL|nr:hypothetical protein EJB05_31797 [Eragrostis curvula]
MSLSELLAVSADLVAFVGPYSQIGFLKGSAAELLVLKLSPKLDSSLLFSSKGTVHYMHTKEAGLDKGSAATSLADKMIESLKFHAVLVCLIKNHTRLVFYQDMMLPGYKKFVSENGIQDEICSLGLLFSDFKLNECFCEISKSSAENPDCLKKDQNMFRRQGAQGPAAAWRDVLPPQQAVVDVNIWKERNRRSFESKNMTVPQMATLTKEEINSHRIAWRDHGYEDGEQEQRVLTEALYKTTFFCFLLNAKAEHLPFPVNFVAGESSYKDSTHKDEMVVQSRCGGNEETQTMY